MPQVTKGSSYAKEVIDFWSVVFQPPKDPNVTPEMIEGNRISIIDKSVQLLSTFKARGGKVIMVRCPSQNRVREIEATYFPRAKYWDELVKAIGSPSYHFEDHEFMNGYELPELAHLATEDAKTFTKAFLDQLKEDNLF